MAARGHEMTTDTSSLSEQRQSQSEQDASPDSQSSLSPPAFWPEGLLMPMTPNDLAMLSPGERLSHSPPPNPLETTLEVTENSVLYREVLRTASESRKYAMLLTHFRRHIGSLWVGPPLVTYIRNLFPFIIF